jgi:mRNA-degrading endonuclease toxin of MazEF toxin-antitoxin module
MNIGDIYWVDLGPGVGAELSGIHKCKITAIFNDSLIRVVPLSTVTNISQPGYSRTIDIQRLKGRVE